MRKILLAASAIVGLTGLVAGQAQAQMADQPLVTPNFSATASGNQPAPATITVRLKAQMWVEGSYGTDTASRASTGTYTAKNSGEVLDTYFRLYPSFDGVTAGGIQYGATVEIRMNSGGLGSNGSFGQSSVSATTYTPSNPGNSLFVRRYNGYVGTPTLGRLYFGPENDALARLAAGSTMEDFDYNGGFNGDFPDGWNGNVNAGNFPYLRGAAQYTSNKLVYLTPAFSGVTAGIAFTPEYTTGNQQCTIAGIGGVTSVTIATGSPTSSNCQDVSSFNGNSSAPRNVVDGAVQYKGSFGPLSVFGFFGGLQGGHVNNNASQGSAIALGAYKNLQILGTGGRITYGPFAVGGQLNWGQENANGNNGEIRQGQRAGMNAVVGAQYIIGTFIFGFQYINQNTAGNYSSNSLYTQSKLHDQGIAVGGAWDWAPGATMYGDIAYSIRHQYGYNFITGATNTNVGNAAQGRIIQIGQTFHW